LRTEVSAAGADAPQLAYLYGTLPARHRGDGPVHAETTRTIADARAELRAGDPVAADRLLDAGEPVVAAIRSPEAAASAQEALREVRAEAALLRFVTALRQASVGESRFAIIGGLAVRARTGAPRRPKNVDVAVLLEPADRWRLVQALEAAGFVVV